MNDAFTELKDDLNQKKARLNFLFKGLAAMAIGSSDQEIVPNNWEAYQALQMAEEILNQMVQQPEQTLKDGNRSWGRR